MEEKVKSSYIIKLIFSFIEEKFKLQLVKYNKVLQKKLYINLINYKFFSGKYIIYEAKVKGKEFNGNNNELLFDGVYLDRKRFGKCKEYKDNKLIFEGEYFNGKKNGKGKEYYIDGTLKFEGEYLNNEKWNGKEYSSLSKEVYELKNGNGSLKEYNYYGKLIFEGKYKEGKRSGKGREYDDNKLIFEGEYLNGRRNGYGKEYHNNRLIFEGEYFNGKKWNIKGYDKSLSNICELKNGKGYIKENRYEGEYLNGERNGKGKVYINLKDLIFEGEYLDGRRKGKGKEYTIIIELIPLPQIIFFQVN